MFLDMDIIPNKTGLLTCKNMKLANAIQDLLKILKNVSMGRAGRALQKKNMQLKVL